MHGLSFSKIRLQSASPGSEAAPPPRKARQFETGSTN